MKILHLSDLHLGRRLYHHSFLPQQEKMLEQVVKIAVEQSVQAVLIAGDVYDKNVPAAEAVTVLDSFLTALSEKKIAVFLISGNHDSAERLQFASQLLEHQGVYIAGTFSGEMQSYDLEDEYGKVHLCLLPFVKQAALSSLVIQEYQETQRTAEVSEKKQAFLQDFKEMITEAISQTCSWIC